MQVDFSVNELMWICDHATDERLKLTVASAALSRHENLDDKKKKALFAANEIQDAPKVLIEKCLKALEDYIKAEGEK